MNDEEIIRFIEKPKEIYEICAEFNKGYTTIYHKLNILRAKGKIKKYKSNKKIVWFKVVIDDAN